MKQSRPGAPHIQNMAGLGFEFADARSGFMLSSCIQRGPFGRAEPVNSNGNSADEALIVCEAFAENHDALFCDFILPNILGMISASHLDYDHDLAELAIDGDVAQPDDVIGEERD